MVENKTDLPEYNYTNLQINNHRTNIFTLFRASDNLYFTHFNISDPLVANS